MEIKRRRKIESEMKKKKVLTEVKTSVVCWMVAMRVHFHFWKSCTLVGLWRVADGCVRKKVGKRWRLDRAGELEP